MSLYINDSIPLYITPEQYNNWINKMEKNKTNTSWIFINQISYDINNDYDYFKYRLYKTLDLEPKLYVLMNYCPANQLPGGGISNTLIKCITYGYGSYFPLDEGRVSVEDVSFLEVGVRDANTINITPDVSLANISFNY